MIIWWLYDECIVTVSDILDKASCMMITGWLNDGYYIQNLR